MNLEYIKKAHLISDFKKRISPWLGLEPTQMISPCNALFFPSRIRRIIFKITRQCTTQKKRMLLQIVCLHYSVITVTVNFSWPVKQDISNSTSSFKGRALIYLRATFYLKCPPRTCIITLSLLNLFATFIPVEAVTSGKLWSPEIRWKRNEIKIRPGRKIRNNTIKVWIS